MALFKWRRNPYRPTSRRQHLINAALGVGTAVLVAILVLDPIERLKRLNSPPRDAAPCTAQARAGCVGGKLEVLLVAPPAVPGNSRAAPNSPASTAALGRTDSPASAPR
jgi:hypothetical protein